MIDPVTAVGLATVAFNVLKQGISAGKDIQEMSGTLAKWGAAFSDFQYAEDKTKNPPFYKMMSDNSSSAIEIFAHKKKMEAMRKEIKDHHFMDLRAVCLGGSTCILRARCAAYARKRLIKSRRR